MAAFASMLPALASGRRVRLDSWDHSTALFVENGELMQQATGEPYPYQLAWHEINAAEWREADSTSNRPQTSL